MGIKVYILHDEPASEKALDAALFQDGAKVNGHIIAPGASAELIMEPGQIIGIRHESDEEKNLSPKLPEEADGAKVVAVTAAGSDADAATDLGAAPDTGAAAGSDADAATDLGAAPDTGAAAGSDADTATDLSTPPVTGAASEDSAGPT